MKKLKFLYNLLLTELSMSLLLRYVDTHSWIYGKLFNLVEKLKHYAD